MSHVEVPAPRDRKKITTETLAGSLFRGRWLVWLGSLRVTLVLFALLAAGVLFYYLELVHAQWLISLPLLLLAVNLLAAIATHATFRSQLPLLAFHLSLLSLLLLLAASRLYYLDGQLEITEGERFSGQLTAQQSGPLHRYGLEREAFRLAEFTIDYLPVQGEPQRDATRATIHWYDQHGREQVGIIGDHRPLVLRGYHFYTTHNKGFAPLFRWQPLEGRSQQGSVHLPSWPAHEFRQAIDWSIPGTTHQLWTQLQFDEVLIDPQRASRFRVPQHHTLVVRSGEARYELTPGASIEFHDGRLTYLELRTWMGLRVTADWTLPWLFAAGVAATLALGWHYWRKFNQRPWQATEDQNE